ncbi:uncharacterized protein DUF1800 [Neolewinella xylanilytica]|uniref:Uncharacterized protein DUF1800 n=2 Tax=Neolewinella xylanilytica TaxID=1514080 RepID=A0A2S6I7R5_9BACT|nr:uncharacterized protein DUF1800 [Neolewinella xylanilytica]
MPRYSGPWDRETAAHLLRRTTYGPRIDEINKAVKDGLEKTLDIVLGDYEVPAPPVKYREGHDPAVKLGKTWVNTPYIGGSKYRNLSFRSWFYNTMLLEEKTTIRDRMVFFWINFFAVHGEHGDARSVYEYVKLYQDLALGNFRTMLERITVEPQMLSCLDGALNHKDNPNENYARELMELFTVGKGELIAKGDYSTFTEKDVVSLARALTGWVNLDFRFSDQEIPVAAKFEASRHDTGDKQLSYHFGNQVIRNGGADEYKVVINILLKSENTALHFCRRLYRYFVDYTITDEIENDVIRPLAQTLLANNYEIRPVLRELFGSEFFYQSTLRGCVIKNPIDLLMSCLRPFNEYKHLDWIDLRFRYEMGENYSGDCHSLQLDFQQPPTISGWKAYYDGPQYHRHWISPALMQQRYWVVKKVTGRNFSVDNNLLPLDLHTFMKSFSNPHDINEVVKEFILIFLPRAISDQQFLKLKSWLLQGSSEMVWSTEMTGYLAHPNNNSYVRPIEDRLYDFFEKFFGMAEFQLQ